MTTSMNNTQHRVWSLDAFRGHEVVTVDGNEHPLVEGKLRILWENFPGADIQTRIVEDTPDRCVVRCTVRDEASGRRATATGTASLPKDEEVEDALLEAAETRSIARALRFFGIGVGVPGAEEVATPRPTPGDQHAFVEARTSDDDVEAKLKEAGFTYSPSLGALTKEVPVAEATACKREAEEMGATAVVHEKV